MWGQIKCHCEAQRREEGWLSGPRAQKLDCLVERLG